MSRVSDAGTSAHASLKVIRSGVLRCSRAPASMRRRRALDAALLRGALRRHANPVVPEHSASGTLPLRDCIRHIEDGDKPEIQVNNVCDLLTAPHGLLRELPIAKLRGQVRSVRYHGANLFICGAGNGSKYHCANELNFFFQVYGEKEWFFVHPKYTPQMDPHFTQPRCNYFGSGVAWGEQPRGVPIGRALLRPGDILVNPPWWWHWVRNRTTTIGVATRWYSWRHRCGTDNVYFSLLQWLFPHQWRLMWSDYVRGGCLDDRKWVHR
ncbi:MAG: cupin-like domain-containing protein [Planctomycetota bacterium]